MTNQNFKMIEPVEFLDVVDEYDAVIGTAPKEDIYKKSLRHRIVHVLIFNTEGKMLLQLRNSNLRFCPDHWSTAVGGHVQSGESYEQAALREYQEELGTTSGLEILAKDDYGAPNSPNKFFTTFTTTHEGPFIIDPEAVARVEFFTIPEINALIDGGEKFHPELLYILKKYYAS